MYMKYKATKGPMKKKKKMKVKKMGKAPAPASTRPRMGGGY